MSKISEKLTENASLIMDEWEDRILREVDEAKNSESSPILRDNLPDLLAIIALALGEVDNPEKVIFATGFDITAQRHGIQRAEYTLYNLSQVIKEFSILQEIVFNTLDTKLHPLKMAERRIIIKFFEQAMTMASTGYMKTLSDAQEQFLLLFAHDVRQPLSSMSLSLEQIFRTLNNHSNIENKGQVLELLAKRLKHGIDRIDFMIKDLLDSRVVRAGIGFNHMDFEETDTLELIKEIVEEYKNIKKGNVELNVQGDISNVIVAWNKEIIRRMLENLINNAIKYGNQDGLVTVTIKYFINQIILIVHNMGNPIPKHEIENLFNSFHRIKQTTKNKQGWGLGLTLVMGAVRAHNGVINVQSSLEDGTSFVITFPRT
jgi:signal transduction histidine kinase